MFSAHVLRVLARTLARLVPRRLHTQRLAAEARVMRLTDEQRRELARNLSRMLRPKTA